MSYIDLAVLILVLMDNQNTIWYNNELLCGFVLILVLMDNQNTIQPLCRQRVKLCLNPCSNG